MKSLTARKKLILLIAIVIALFALVMMVVNRNDKPVTDLPGAASADTGDVQNKGLIVEDKAVVEVDIPEDAPAPETPAEG
jgi:hypothetical protein